MKRWLISILLVSASAAPSVAMGTTSPLQTDASSSTMATVTAPTVDTSETGRVHTGLNPNVDYGRGSKVNPQSNNLYGSGLMSGTTSQPTEPVAVPYNQPPLPMASPFAQSPDSGSGL